MNDNAYTLSKDTFARLRECRADVEVLADTDLPVAVWAGELLALLDEYDSRRSNERQRP